ncbi:predicted protein [Uncinocarpus reesii 1704]|uniref:Uncharacterized protein n=1 Tax=Uncinocarpus reesii (strain UAMH 1704) TaxID=336963 RepID=C4JGA3_UNCRE|nr:uncharacterized protein UREG_02501 [Uncinocarpus reesii 1704]EEP77652.1 predicted protein [Uncinocarpus reesii 1704]
MAVPQKRLSEAAVAVSKILSDHGIKHGVFGGWAVNVLGGNRATKDIDLMAAIGKDELWQLMEGRIGWVKIPNMREDYAPFFWDDALQRPVLVEIFIGDHHHLSYRISFLKLVGSTASPANTENARRAMRVVDTQTVLIDNEPVQLLAIVSIFKGKLHAAADRAKVSDAMDLKHLLSKYAEHLRPHATSINLRDVGKAVRRYPELSEPLSSVGIDVFQAQEIQSDEVTWMSPPTYNVQKGIME